MYYEKLKGIREDRDIKQQEIALLLKTTKQQISKYENGIQDMTVLRFMKLCEYYKVSADYILDLNK